MWKQTVSKMENGQENIVKERYVSDMRVLDILLNGIAKGKLELVWRVFDEHNTDDSHSGMNNFCVRTESGVFHEYTKVLPEDEKNHTVSSVYDD